MKIEDRPQTCFEEMLERVCCEVYGSALCQFCEFNDDSFASTSSCSECSDAAGHVGTFKLSETVKAKVIKSKEEN